MKRADINHNNNVVMMTFPPFRGEGHVLGRAGEAQEGEGGVEKKGSAAGGPGVCPPGKPAINEQLEDPFH